MVGFAIGFALGAVLGSAIALVVCLARTRAQAQEHRANEEVLRAGEQTMREAFRSLATEALDANAKRLSDLSAATLEGKQQLIDQTVQSVQQRLAAMNELLQRIESDRKADLGRLGQAVTTLSTTTGELHRMLASTQRRGAWGERMADDILRLVGFIEGVNYSKQSAADAETGRPDFTFYLSESLKLNMDVKFPLESYKLYVDAADDPQRKGALGQLVRDIRGHVTTVARRGYIDTQNGTVNYVLLFVPSEHVYSLALEHGPDLIDEALRQRVVLASPLTLYAMLAVVRQAAEHANIMQTADEVIELLGEFSRQWQRYNEEMDKLGQRLEAATKQFETVRTTRTNMLQRQVDRIEDLRTARGLPSE